MKKLQLALFVFWTETSAGLQKILQEIQPRDTNDFFTSARELEPQQGDDHTQTPSLDTGNVNISLVSWLFKCSTCDLLVREVFHVVTLHDAQSGPCKFNKCNFTVIMETE